MYDPKRDGILEGIIFDHDGVLSQTAPRQYDWFKHWASVNKKKLPYTNFDEFLTDYNDTLHKAEDVVCGVQAFYDKFKLPCDMKDKKHPVWTAYDKYKTKNPVGLFPGMKEVVATVHQLGSLLPTNLTMSKRLRLAINTTNSWASISTELEKTEVLHYFDSQIGIEMLRVFHGAGDGNALKKPSSVSVGYSLLQLGTDGDYTMHVGDTRADLAASRNVLIPGQDPRHRKNLIMVGAAWGYEGRKKLEEGTTLENGEQTHFDYIIDKPKDLIWLVRKHRGL